MSSAFCKCFYPWATGQRNGATRNYELEDVEKGNVSAIYSKGTSIEGRFTTAITWPPPDHKDARSMLSPRLKVEPRTANTFTTELPAFVDPGLEALLMSNKVEISAVPIQNS